MDEFILIYPSKEYENKVHEYKVEFLEYKSHINGSGGLQRYDNYDEWLLKVKGDLDVLNIQQGRVPASTYFFVRTEDDKIIGMINIRHKLHEGIKIEGGHIGYSIRPTERKKGYATLMLSMGLEKCRELELDKVLITCDKINIASAKVIQNNNGILENEVISPNSSNVIQRYWVYL